MAATASVSGLVSGIQTDEIISKVMALAKRPQQLLEAKKAKAQYALAAWQDINTRTLALQTKCYSISSSSSFLARTATSSDEKIATASATANALTGTYSIKVNSKAQNHQIASQTYTSIQDNIGTGSLSVTLANGESFEIAVDENNNTLAGLKDSINRANQGVTASIVNQGTETVPQYRLMLSSNKTGTDYAMSVTATGINLIIDQEIQAAKNAEVTLGNGANAITVSKPSNSITDLIPGVTINVLNADTVNAITITVAKSTDSVKTAIQDFVNQFNDLATAINAQSDYDAEIKDTPALMGSYQLQSIQNELASMITRRVDGLTGTYTSISSIGITLGSDGLLTIDNTKLSSVLENNQTEVSKLFGANLESDNALITYATSTNETQPSGTRGWEVSITQAARRAQVTAGKEMTSPLTSDETLVIGGNEIKLTAGMTIDQVISAINSKSTTTNVSAFKSGADGTGTGNYITIRSNTYGSKYTFNISSNMSQSLGGVSGFGNVVVSPDSPLGESGSGQGVVGLDVEGTINGETCIGKGQILTADSVNSSSAINGLSLIVSATNPMNTYIRFTKGIGATMQEMLTKLTSTSGTLSTAQNTLNDEIDALTNDISEYETKLTSQENRLTEQYANMETKLSELQNQSSTITALFSSYTKNSD